MSIQNQIDRIKANMAESYAAVSENGGTIPESQNSDNLPDAIRSIPVGVSGTVGFTIAAIYTTPGSYTFSAESDVTDILAIIIGGGGAGGAARGSSSLAKAANGGASGEIKYVFRKRTKTNWATVVGRGGAGVTASTTGEFNGAGGGTSSFDGVTALGGSGGEAGTGTKTSTSYLKTHDMTGFQIPHQSTNSIYYDRGIPYGGVPVVSSSAYTLGNQCADGFTALTILNFLMGETITHMSAGGAVRHSSSTADIQNIFTYQDNNKKPSPGKSSLSGSVATPGKATEPGCGGGGVCAVDTSTSGSGSDGAVYVFVKKG